MTTRCGTVALLGRPNVGKSTLLNALLGEKLSAVTHKAQTTRHLIRGILTHDQTQIVLVDLPGVHGQQPSALNRYMNRVAAGSLGEVDLILLLVEAGRWQEDDARALQLALNARSPVALVLTKVDRLKPKSRLLPFIAELSARHSFAFVVPVSALSRDNVAALQTEIETRMPPGEFMFEADQLTDRSERFLAAEAIREKLMLVLHQEVPYKLTVEIESFKDTDRRSEISAVIWVERDSQKAIVIGQQGSVLKRVGREARIELKERFGRPVHLELWVKARDGWADDERSLRALGYE